MTDEPSPAQSKPTSNRRRQGRNGGRNAAQKAYASENDAGLNNVSRRDATPQTPDKNNNGRQRNKAKSARKNNNSNNGGPSTSPETDSAAMNPNHRHQTPSRPVAVKAGPNAIAFAGATFHASPAPSALPMPSFFSKGSATPVESPASKAALHGQNQQGSFPQQPSPPATDAGAPTPQRSSGPAGISDSPLDFMFKAHRQEKERQRSDAPNGAPLFDGIDSLGRAAPASNSPSSNGFHPRGSSSVPHMPRHHDPFNSRDVNQYRGGFNEDRFGHEYSQPVGPAFSTPYQDRIKAARPNGNQDRNISQQQSPGAQQAANEDPSEALKRFLFSGSAQSPSAAPSYNVYNNNNNSYTSYNNNPVHHRAPFPTQPVHAMNQGPPPVQAQASHGHSNIQDMEKDLRRILRLDQGAPTANTERRLFTQ